MDAWAQVILLNRSGGVHTTFNENIEFSRDGNWRGETGWCQLIMILGTPGEIDEAECRSNIFEWS